MAKEHKEPGLGYQCTLVRNIPGIKYTVVAWFRDKNIQAGDTIEWDGDQWAVEFRSAVYHE